MKTAMRRTLASVILLLTMGLGSTLRAQSSSPVHYFYDAAGRLTSVVDTSGNAAVYNYDAVGNLHSITRSALPGSNGLAILNFTPQQGPVGATVTIQGQGFSATPSADLVEFDGTPATVTAATATALTVTVPSGATTGPISVTVAGVTVTSSSNFKVVAPTLVSIIVSPPLRVILNGSQQQFVAIGTYAEGVTQDVTASVTWSSSNSGVATISNSAGTQGLALAVSTGYTVVRATSGSVYGSTSLTVETLTSLTVTPSSYCLAQGATEQFRALASYADGTTGTATTDVIWSSSNTTVATISNTLGSQGLATGLAEGATTITATFGGFTASAVLGVSNLAQLAVWGQQDVGQVAVAGCGSYASDTFTVEGSGTGIWGAADGFQFVYQPLSGDGTITARVTSLPGTGGANAGVMIRETMSANSADAYVAYQVPNGLGGGSSGNFIDRPSDGGSNNLVASTGASLPYWVRVVRSGNTFTGYGSLDGLNWVPMGSQTITMAQNAYVGLAVTRAYNPFVATATFDNVSVSSAAAPAPVINTVSATTGLAGTQVVLSGSGFGAAQGDSLVLLNGSPVTINAWSNTSITITIPAGATTGPLVVSVAPTMNDSNPVYFEVTAFGLPIGWLDQDVGAVEAAGSATFSNGVFTVQGSGTGIWGAADGFHFIYQPLSGDGTITARVTSLPGTGGANAGVMIRETMSANAADAYVAYQVPNGLGGGSSGNFIDRPSDGGSNNLVASTGASLPYWVRVVRSGSTFSAYSSLDGVNWVQVGASQTITMAQNVYIGLAVTRAYNSLMATATFDNVSVSSAATAAPVISGVSATTGPVGSQVVISGSGFEAVQGGSQVLLNGSPVIIDAWSNTSITITIPAGATSGPLVVSVAPLMNDSNPVYFEVTALALPIGWLDQDVGAVEAAGSATFSNGVFTVQGSGTGIWGAADGFHFVYQPLSGDGTITARVTSLPGTGGANAGVMIRETMSANSADAYVAYQVPNGLGGGSSGNFIDRPSDGGSNNLVASTGASLPYWVRVVRSGSTFSAYSSLDGVNWVQVGASQTITMAQNVYIGLAVTRAYNSLMATATFDNVSVSSAAVPAPVISGVSATTGPVGSQVEISGSGFGAVQGESLVLLNGSPVIINSWSDTSITITIPAGATSGPLVVSVAPLMNDSNSVYFEVTAQPLPIGWLDQDVGTLGIEGSASYSNGMFTVAGSGSNIWGTADGFHFVYQPLSGDGTITARVVNVTGSSSAIAGVMIRETMDAGATNAKEAFWGGYNVLEADYRGTAGGSTTELASAGAALPYWMRVVRSGNTFSEYTSSDGVNWVQMGASEPIAMAENVYIGMVVCSHNNSVLATATFDNVSVSSAAVPAPAISGVSATTGPVGSQVEISGSGFGATQGSSLVLLNESPVIINSWSDTSITITIPAGATSGPLVVSVAPLMNDSNPVYFEVTAQPLPIGWLDQDVGTLGIEGSASYSNGVFTVAGSGSNIWGTADGFHFVYQPLSGDGTITARVVNVTGSSSAIAGVMIRETMDAGATNAKEAFWGGYNVLEADYRGTAGGSTTELASAGAALPYWMRVVRSGNTFSEYTSSDGVNWVQMGASEPIAMAENVYIGMVVCSHNNSVLATATFDNVSVSSAAVPAPAISGVSATTGPVGSQVEISGSGFGATQGESVVLLNGSPVIVNAWSDTSITITIPAGATTGLLVVSVAPSMNDSNPVMFTVAKQPLIGWMDLDVGQVGVAGSASYANGVFTVQASGQWIWSVADGMHFVFQPLSGDGEITARVVSLTGTTYAQAGVMIRETLNAASANAYGAYQSNQNPPIKFFFRPSTGASATAETDNFNVTLPYWVQVVRSGNTFSAYASPDGVNWVQIGSSQTIAMAENVYIGLALSSDANSALATATFDNVSVNGVMASLGDALPFVYADRSGSPSWSGVPSGSTNVMDSAADATTGALAPMTWLLFGEGLFPESATTEPLGWLLYALPGDSIFESRR
jgi:YD repeat-containing protein